MLWRAHYSTRVATDVPMPPIAAKSLLREAFEPKDGVIIGGFSPQAHTQQQIWMRLMESEFGSLGFSLLFIAKLWTKGDAENLSTILAPSLHPLTYLANDAQETWRALIEPDSEQRAFAAVVRGGRLSVLMVGPPTEEAWDEFSSHVHRIS